MSLPTLSAPSAAKLPTGPSVSTVLDEMRPEFGFELPAQGATATLPPWTPEEAAAFAHVVNEAFERIDPPANRS